MRWVNGEGPIPSPLMIVGEAPAKEEDAKGRPFVGRTGREVDNLIRERLRMRRSDLYITNTIKYMLPDNKEIGKEEWEMACATLVDEIEKVKPKVILALGSIACRFFFNNGQDMEAMNANTHMWNGITVVPSFHPAAAFHDPLTLQWVIEAFDKAKEELRNKSAVLEPHKPEIKRVEIEKVVVEAEGVVGVDTETYEDGSPYTVQLAVREDEAAIWYVDNKNEFDLVQSVLKENTAIMHNALFDVPVLEECGLKVEKLEDTMIRAFLHQTLPLGLKAIAYKFSKWTMMEYEEAVEAHTYTNSRGKIERILWPDLSWAEESKRHEYMLADPCATLMVDRHMKNLPTQIDEGVFIRDINIMPMLLSMMKRGFKVDKSVLDTLKADLSYRNFELLETMIEKWPIVQSVARTKTTKTRGTERIEDFNPGSDKQLSELLYEKLKLNNGKVKKSRWGGSVDQNHLKKLEGKHPIVPLIQDWRETQTLIDDFIDTLPEHIGTDGRIHTKISMIRVKHSGRLASSNPNLMNQPTRTSDGQRIREAFVPERGYGLWSFDYNQIEMRLMAHLSGDPTMCKAYIEGKDIHTETAMRIFGITKPEDVDEMKHRYPSKRTGFGIINNISAEGLARELVDGGAGIWTVDRCQELLNTWFKVYRGVRDFMMRVKSEARLHGVVYDMWGRMEYVPAVWACDDQMKEKALRVAINQKIQSGAQGIIKEAMGKFVVDGLMENWEKWGWAYPLIQIHDDVVWEISKEADKEIPPIIKHVMENAVKISIPIKVGVKKSYENWGKLEKATWG